MLFRGRGMEALFSPRATSASRLSVGAKVLAKQLDDDCVPADDAIVSHTQSCFDPLS